MSCANTLIEVVLDGKNTEVAPGTTVLDLLVQNRLRPWRPEGVDAVIRWVGSHSCPLLKLVEIDGKVRALSVVAGKRVSEGMEIKTHSARLEETLTERLEYLRDRHECLLIREAQEVVAAEAESAGLIDLAGRAQWDFEPRRSGPSILHDPNTCVRCGSCVATCNDMQQVGALTMDEENGVILDEDKCVRCGQCILNCPTGFRESVGFMTQVMGCRECAFSRPLGALREVDETKKVVDALNDPDRVVVVQFAPAIRATIGEEFGLDSGEVVTERLYAALRKIGFDQVWDTNFAADLTIMEEGHELLRRVGNEGVLPQFTSCSPGWIRYCETNYPDLIPNLSSAKSPQQMFGAVAKSYGAEKLGVDPRKMVVVSIMPCTAKKTEAAREELDDAYRHWLGREKVSQEEAFQDVDVVLTTREAVKLLKLYRIDLAKIDGEKPDSLLGEYTGAAPIFGRTGGVMEAALRTAYEVLTNEPLEKLELEELGTLEGIKTAVIPVAGLELKVAVVHGLGNAKKVCDSIRSGGEFAEYHFIEFMACPGGCIGGGGQPIPTNTKARRERTVGLNEDDRQQPLRKSQENAEVELLYQDFLKEPLGHLAHHLLHTEYTDRSDSV